MVRDFKVIVNIFISKVDDRIILDNKFLGYIVLFVFCGSLFVFFLVFFLIVNSIGRIV